MPITMLDSRCVLSFPFFLSCFFSLKTDEMLFVLFPDCWVCRLSLEDQKSGTVGLSFFLLNYMQLINPPYRSIVFLRNDGILL